jgi:multidrug efflux pump subunit AcrA (membrane-fusion protein)
MAYITDITAYSACDHLYLNNRKSKVRYWFYGIIAALVFMLFLPWTQNIRSRGNVTTLRQEQRPQEVNSIIPGRVVSWMVKEGDYVKAGDTILQLSEIKDDYLDPNLLGRTQEQLSAKQASLGFYKSKIGTAGQQIGALGSALGLKQTQLQNKQEQLRLKLESDKADLQAANNEYNIATMQYKRAKIMYDSGAIPFIQFEQRNQALQNANAKKTSAENKLANTQQEQAINRIEMNSIEQEYAEKISKAQGDQFQSMSQIATGQGDIAKLQNQYSNYNIRNGLYYIRAPQSGQITKAKKAGIGEIVKDGEMIVEIVPDHIDYAIELFVRPVDIPLLDTGQKVRFLFDGFPAIVFSGWPNASYGTFGGKVAAIESSVSPNGLFRILVKEDPADKKWPYQLRMGAGAQGMALMKDVPIWYELWRQINGFPPDYYKASTKDKDKDKKK